MKQVQFAAFGTPHEVAACVEVPDVGAPGPDEVVIEVEAFPIEPRHQLFEHGPALLPRMRAEVLAFKD